MIRFYLKLLYKFDVRGKDNIPAKGPVILISNHISNLDPVIVGCAIDRIVYYMAKEELFDNNFAGKILSLLGAFPVKRDSSDRKALKKGIDILKNQEVLGIFPEGTRSLDGEIGKGLPGAAYIALKSDAIVIPVGIVSEYKLFQPIIIKFGKPILLDKYKTDKISSEKTIEVTEYMMERIKDQVNVVKGING